MTRKTAPSPAATSTVRKAVLASAAAAALAVTASAANAGAYMTLSPDMPEAAVMQIQKIADALPRVMNGTPVTLKLYDAADTTRRLVFESEPSRNPLATQDSLFVSLKYEIGQSPYSVCVNAVRNLGMNHPQASALNLADPMVAGAASAAVCVQAGLSKADILRGAYRDLATTIPLAATSNQLDRVAIGALDAMRRIGSGAAPDPVAMGEAVQTDNIASSYQWVLNGGSHYNPAASTLSTGDIIHHVEQKLADGSLSVSPIGYQMVADMKVAATLADDGNLPSSVSIRTNTREIRVRTDTRVQLHYDLDQKLTAVFKDGQVMPKGEMSTVAALDTTSTPGAR